MDFSSFFPPFLTPPLLFPYLDHFMKGGEDILSRWLIFQNLLHCFLQLFFFHIVHFLELCLIFKWAHKQVKSKWQSTLFLCHPLLKGILEAGSLHFITQHVFMGHLNARH